MSSLHTSSLSADVAVDPSPFTETQCEKGFRVKADSVTLSFIDGSTSSPGQADVMHSAAAAAQDVKGLWEILDTDTSGTIGIEDVWLGLICSRFEVLSGCLEDRWLPRIV